MTTPGEALQTSTAAGAAAGSRAADSTTAGCDLVRVGIFFDGTGNSRAHIGTDNIDSWHSNVDLLERLYKKSAKPETVTVNGARLRANFGSRYIRGVGIEEGGGNQQWGIPRGLAWGTGPEGVASRTREGLDAARAEIRVRARGMEPCYVWLDTFGFSRGACVSRDFANHIKDGAIVFAGKTAQVMVMGLWDTVSSIGNAGNTGNWPDENVRINTNGTARHIVHITAKDELRVNFPLTLAQGGKRIQMVGVHSDVGGGYAPGVNTGTVAYSAGSQDAFFETIAEKWGLPLGNWQRSFTVQSRESARVEGDRLSEVMVQGSWMKAFNWSAQHGLQFVSLRLMHDQALAQGAPLAPLGNAIEGIDVSLSGDLLAYYNQLKNAPHASDPATELNIRRKHAHMSVANSTGMGPEPSGRRRVTTL